MEIQRYSIGPRTRKYVKGYGLLLFSRKYKNQLLGTGLDAVKTTSKKSVHKAGTFLGKKIADAITIVKQEPVEEIIIPPKEIYKILNKLRKV